MTDNRKDEIRDLNLDELESVAAGNFDLDKLTYEEEMLYFALKNRFIDLLVLQGQGKATFEEVCTAQKQFVDYSEQLKIKYPREPKDIEIK